MFDAGATPATCGEDSASQPAAAPVAGSEGSASQGAARAIEAVDAVLRDGTPVVIRAVRPSDRDHIAGLFARMSPSSVRHRFFAAKRGLTDKELRFLVGNGSSHVALAVIARGDATETFLGAGRYVVIDEVPDTAEVAFEVADAEQGHGIGTLLLEHLARVARARGIGHFCADVEADNSAMLDVFAHSGFVVSQSCSQGCYRVDMAIADSDVFLAAAAARARTAASAACAACAARAQPRS